MENRAATIIQKNVRTMIWKDLWRRTKEKRHAAARMIQRNFKEYRRFKVIPRAIKARRMLAATVIQTKMRGFVVRKTLTKVVLERRVAQNYQYFSVLRQRLLLPGLVFRWQCSLRT